MDAVIQDIVGANGKWQIRTFFATSVIALMGSIMTFISSFTLFLPAKYRCLIPECGETTDDPKYDSHFAPFTIPDWNKDTHSTDDQCHRFKPTANTCTSSSFDKETSVLCAKHVYDTSQYANSLVMQLDIPPCTNVNDNDWLLDPLVTQIQFLSFAFMAGLLIGSLVTGIGADFIGRRKTILISLILSWICVLFGGIFGGNFWVYAALRGLNGVFCVALFTNSFVILVEMVAPVKRDFYGIVINVPFAGGELLLSLLAYLFQEWTHLHFCVGAIALVSTGTLFIIPESPRWLLSMGKRKEAIDVLKKGAITNGKTDVKDSDFHNLYTAELFPTEVRNSLLGISSMSGRIGGISAPFIASLGSISATLPFIIMGIFAIIGGILGLLLPETLGVPLPETLSDITALKKNPTPLSRLLFHRRTSVLSEERVVNSIPEIIIQAPSPNVDLERKSIQSVVQEESVESLNEDEQNTDSESLESEENNKSSGEEDVIKESLSTNNSTTSALKNIAGPSLILPKGASRKFSQLSPAPIDSPEAKRIGNFVMIPTVKDNE